MATPPPPPIRVVGGGRGGLSPASFQQGQDHAWSLPTACESPGAVSTCWRAAGPRAGSKPKVTGALPRRQVITECIEERTCVPHEKGAE